MSMARPGLQIFWPAGVLGTGARLALNAGNSRRMFT